MARTADVLADVAKANAAATKKVREIVAQPRESVRTHKAVCAALAKFRPEKPHPLLEAASFAVGGTAIREAMEHLGASRSIIAEFPAMHRALVLTDKAMRMAREAEREFDRTRPCEVRHHLPRPGRAPRRATNTRRHGSRRAGGIRSGQDPGADDSDGDADDHRQVAA